MNRATLLLVDDNPVIREVFQASLEDAGYCVATLDSALKLNGAISKHDPDLILLDISMPALSGDKAVAFLKQRRFASQIPVLLFSDAEEPVLKRLTAESGASGYVRKSPDHGPLLAAINRHLATSLDDGHQAGSQ